MSASASRSVRASADPLSMLAPAEEEWRARIAAFAAASVGPRAAEMDDKGMLDPQLSAELFAEGLMGIEIPQAYGGAGADLLWTVLAIEEIARHDASVGVLVDVQNALVGSAVLRHGSGDQRRRFLPRLATTATAAYALSEQEAGSDAFALSTTAAIDGSGYRVSGRKRWTTNAASAGLFLVFARVPDQGLAAFLIERDAPGLTVAEPMDKLGIRATSTCDLVLEDVPVGRENVIGRPGHGDVVVIETLNVGRLGIAAELTGLASGAIDDALGYAQSRQQFGRPITDYQGVSFPLARLAAELAAARTFLYQATRLMMQPDRAGAERLRAGAIAKLLASEIAERAAAQAIETLGGNGFLAESAAARRYRDAKVGKIYEGTSNMQLRTIAATA